MSNYYIPGLCEDDTYYGIYRTNTFADIFPSKDAFKEASAEIGLGGVTEESLNILWTLLYARRANDPILSTDEQRFKMDLFSIVYKYGPEWEKKREIQETIKNLSEDDLRAGTTAVNNFAENPSTLPETQQFEPLKKINSQTSTGYRKSKIEALALQEQMLSSRYIEDFLSRFDKLFSPFPAGRPLVYEV